MLPHLFVTLIYIYTFLHSQLRNRLGIFTCIQLPVVQEIQETRAAGWAAEYFNAMSKQTRTARNAWLGRDRGLQVQRHPFSEPLLPVEVEILVPAPSPASDPNNSRPIPTPPPAPMPPTWTSSMGGAWLLMLGVPAWSSLGTASIPSCRQCPQGCGVPAQAGLEVRPGLAGLHHLLRGLAAPAVKTGGYPRRNDPSAVERYC